MAYRFRKRFKIAPGLHLNASSSGLGFSVGPRGATVSVGPSGTYLNTKIPGLPLYERKKLSGPTRARRPTAVDTGEIEDMVFVRDLIAENQCIAKINPDSGEIILERGSVGRLTDNQARIAWKYIGDVVLEQVQNAIAESNRKDQALGLLHHLIPHPFAPPAHTPKAFERIPPVKPRLRSYHWFLKLFSSHRQSVDRRNADVLSVFNAEQVRYDTDRRAFEKAEDARAQLFGLRSSQDASLLEAFLEDHLRSLVWPRETLIALEITSDVKSVFLDVDLPEIEHMPVSSLEVIPGKRIVREKPLGEVARRRLYMAHIHAIGLRLIGECFAHLQQIDTVTFSGFSQRVSPTTAAVEDEYLLSTRVDRSTWSRIDFSNLEQLDPVAAYERFETRRKMTGSGVLKAIEPFMP